MSSLSVSASGAAADAIGRHVPGLVEDAVASRLFAKDATLYATTPTARRDVGYERGKHPHHAGYPDGKRPVLPPRPAKGLTVTLWTTALNGADAYVTRLRHRGGAVESRVLKVSLVAR